MDWKECNFKRLTKKIKEDKNLKNALINSSEKKLKTENLIELNNDSASSKISLKYEVLRELLEALAVSNGFKIYNHECYCYFLKEVLNKNNLGDKFDKLRKIRNDINYYGKDVKAAEAKIILSEIKDLIQKIKSLINFL